MKWRVYLPLILAGLLGLVTDRITTKAQAPDGPVSITAVDAGACATASACAVFPIRGGVFPTIDVSGTFVGTLTFESSTSGSNWATLSVFNSSGTAVSTATAPGSFPIATATPSSIVRLRATAWTSGTAVVAARFLATTTNYNAVNYQRNGRVWVSGAAPTVSSGFGTSPSIVANNGTAAFTIDVGTGGTAQTGVIGFPAASTGWRVSCDDVTTKSATVYLTKQTVVTATTATVGLFDAAGAAAAWAASDILVCSATAY